MQCAVVLNVASGTNLYPVTVAAQDRAVPDAGTGSDQDVADHSGAGRDERIGINVRGVDTAWLRRRGPAAIGYPASFADAVAVISAFPDPPISGEARAMHWDPDNARWTWTTGHPTDAGTPFFDRSANSATNRQRTSLRTSISATEWLPMRTYAQHAAAESVTCNGPRATLTSDNRSQLEFSGFGVRVPGGAHLAAHKSPGHASALGSFMSGAHHLRTTVPSLGAEPTCAHSIEAAVSALI
ncbi:hypothetical protein JOF29_002834 [Kribbella aluminosa]|uniref:Uncharacterized protein n=1 Tax=Kribbella aluminosa TaxID=416017 RepID=A0ABS4UJC5_9ACTN|nr:hypothetical protein [Kribbella aluminosa]